MKKGYKMTEEHKRKIGLANAISNKGKHCSPKTEFKKGSIPMHKGKGLPQIREENHYKWDGGTRATARRIAKRGGKDMNICQICKEDKKRIEIHHIDGNSNNNKLNNLGVVCSYCHFAIHDNGRNTRFGGNYARNN